MATDTETTLSVEADDQTMPRWVPRAIGLFWLGLIGIWVLQRLFESLSGFLITILISLFFSFALEPAVNWLERKGFRRGLGTLIMFAVVSTAVAVLSFVVGSALAEPVSYTHLTLPTKA